MRFLNQENKERRYNHKEEKRNMKINLVIERRKEIIENQKKQYSKVLNIK
jgi:hypothetical protein